MQRFNRLAAALSGLVMLSLVVALVATLVLPTEAAPGAQGGALPTPSPAPVDTLDYTLTSVGGVDETLTFAHDPVEGFTLGSTVVRSLYPDGMVFTIAPQADDAAIEDVILFIRFVHGSGERVAASYNAEQAAWVARPWENGAGQPAWTHFDFYWRVRDTNGAYVDTEPVTLDYWDPGRAWYRVETPHYVVYWFGLNSEPDSFARAVAYGIYATHQRRLDGFGAAISYTPIGVIYPNRTALSEIYGSGYTNTRAAGFTSGDLGMTVNMPFGDLPNSILLHELTHLWQYDVLGKAPGPLWWYEGQAEWFSLNPGNYDARLFSLGSMGRVPSLHTPVGSGLGYDAGPSFINWLVATYGLETMRAINLLSAQAIPFYDAIEQATGTDFLTLENGWRRYIGAPDLTLADVDPAAALEPYEDDLIAAGDMITLPDMPPLVHLLEHPKPRSLGSGTCFGGMDITVLRVGQLAGNPWYEIDCMGMIGWVTRDALVVQ